MKMQNAEVYLLEGQVCVSQQDDDGHMLTIRLEPEQCPLLAQWITEAARSQAISEGASAKA